MLFLSNLRIRVVDVYLLVIRVVDVYVSPCDTCSVLIEKIPDTDVYSLDHFQLTIFYCKGSISLIKEDRSFGKEEIS